MPIVNEHNDLIEVVFWDEIVEQGNHEQLLTIEGGYYRNLYDVQFASVE